MGFKIEHSRVWISLKDIAWALEVDEEVNLDLFPKLRRMELLLWLGLVLLYNWLKLSQYTYPSWMSPFHITSSG